MNRYVKSLGIPATGAIVFALLVASGTLTITSTEVAADDGQDVRAAGGEEHFRVIDRFPDDDDAAQIHVVAEESPFHPVIESVRHEDWSNAHQRLSDPGLASKLEGDAPRQFLAGYIALEAGDAQRAAELLTSINDSVLPVLSDYRAYYAAKAAMELEDFHTATIQAALVSEDSRLYRDAIYLLARALVEAGETKDRERAAEVMDLYLARWGDGNDGPRVSLLLGETLKELDRPQEAARVYFELYDGRPLRSEAREAEQRLTDMTDLLTSEQRTELEEESVDRLMRRYHGLYNLHRSERVIDELGPRIDGLTAGSAERCQGLFKIAHSHTKLRRHGDGTDWYQRVLDECADTSYHRRALYHGARGMWNSGNRPGAIRWFQRLWNEYPDDSIADDAMYLQARVLRSADRPDEAHELLEQLVETYPDGDMLKDAHWFLVRRLFETDDLQGVVDFVDGLDDTGEDDLYTRGRLHYFRGRALEMLGEDEEAEEAFSQVARDHPMSYYALLALNRLARVADDDSHDVCEAAAELCDEILSADPTSSPIEVPDVLREDGAFQRGTKLLTLGLDTHARAEFSVLRSRHAHNADTLWALAALLDRAGAYPISHNIARRHISGWMDEYPSAQTRQQWEVAYPTPFMDEVTRYADQRHIPAAKIYAIMREESGFHPRIESWANARGLLQLLDATAERMAARDGMNPYSFDRLDDPDVNVRLGSAYMELLGEQFDDHPVLVSAGYNGGSANVRNWLDSFGDLPLDLFVEDIPFHQTRNYAKRVTMSYWIYSYLYGEARVPRLAFDLPN